MHTNKSEIGVRGNQIRIGVEFTKIDREQRTVTGFATLNNVDQHDDIVSASASREAFAAFRGNIREMHQPIAVGTLKEFYSDIFYTEDGDVYEGIVASVYVSKGAQDTWEKVLDGTLSGFSIGGAFDPEDVEFKMVDGKQIRVINKYRLTELSLVDSPANQFANVLSVAKLDGTELEKGVETSRVFYCPADILAVTRKASEAECPACNCQMNVIGEFNEAVVDVEKFVFDSMKQTIEKREGGVDVSETNDEVTTEAAETVEKAAEVDEVTVDEETVEKSEEGAEASVEVEEDDATVEKSDAVVVDEAPTVDLESVLDEVRKAIDLSSAEAEDSVRELEKRVESRLEDLGAEFKKAMDSLNETVEKLNAVKDTDLVEMTKRLEALEGSAAFRKSAVADGTEERVEKTESIWGGQILNG